MRAAFAARFLLVAAVAMASWVKGLAHGVKDRVKGGRDVGGTCATQVELNFGVRCCCAPDVPDGGCGFC
jgi:hypothetical protein